MGLNYDFKKQTTVLPTTVRPLDIDAAKKPFKKYELKVAEMRQKVDVLVVDDDDSAKLATEMGSQISQIIKTLEAERKKTIQEPDGFVRAINTFFRGFRGPLDGMKSAIKKKIGDYSYKKELIRRKAEAAAQRERDRQQAELDRAAKEANVEPVKMPTMVVPRRQEPVRSESGSSSTRYKWTFEIMDREKIPGKYLMPDEKAIQNAVDAGIRDIGGVRIYEKPIVSIRG